MLQYLKLYCTVCRLGRCFEDIKTISNPSKRSNVFFELLALNFVLVFLRFLPRYYGSCYRLQHVEKKTQKRHVKEQTCQTVGTCRKEKKGERRQKKRKGAKIARCLIKKLSRLRSILYFSYQLLEPSKHFCTLS